MNSVEYQTVLANALSRFTFLTNQKEEIEVELDKLRQFIFATVNMLPDDEPGAVQPMDRRQRQSLGRSREQPGRRHP